jgi:glycosyltransferase involved in cell wall biosynthesis
MKSDVQYKLINFSLRVTRGMGTQRRARLLTLFHSLYQIFVHGHEEVWLRKRLLNLPLYKRLYAPFPYAIRSRLWGASYAIKSYRAGYIHPGVLRYFDVNEVDEEFKKQEKVTANGWPDFIIRDLEALSEIEPDLYPDEEFLSKFHSYMTPIEELPGRLYGELYKKLSGAKFDAFVIVPWVRHGGADKGILQYIEYYQQRGLKVMLITTYPGHSTWLDRAHEEVEVIELGLVLNMLMRADQELVLARLILQKKPRIIHVVQSEMGYRVLRDFCRSFRSIGIKIISSVFTHEIAKDGRRIGYAQDFLPDLRLCLSGILSDNKKFLSELQWQFAIDIEKSFFVPFYIDAATRTREIKAGRRPSFLWASRFCQEKRPDLLLEIAREISEVDFYIYGDPDDVSIKEYKILEKMPHVFLMGKYNSFFEIAEIWNYSGFIYTTKFDGTPNVLLEAGAMGLPVIAPLAVGGIGDLITSRTGYPISEANSAELYIDAMRQVVRSPIEAQKRGDALRELVLSRHSRESFFGAMDDVVHHLEKEQVGAGQ